MAWLHATYLVDASAGEIAARAEALALEQSVEMPLSAVRSKRVRDEIVGRVTAVAPAGDGRFRVTLRLAAATTGGEITQILNMLFGNCSLQDDVTLETVDLPEDIVRALGGPRFGIEGIRRLCGVETGPLTCTALKPQGSSPDELAALCETFALAGIDVVKDDHGLADQSFAPFAERVRSCQAAVERAERATGKTVLYVPSLVGTPSRLASQARFAREAGVRMVLIAPMLVGLPAFAELLAAGPQLAVLAHPAFGGAGRIVPPWLFGTFFRLLGADAVIFPNYGGRFAYDRSTCIALAEAARKRSPHVRPALPVPAGGMTLERIPEMLEVYGDDVMLLIGGGLLVAGDALGERSRGFAAKVRAR